MKWNDLQAIKFIFCIQFLSSFALADSNVSQKNFISPWAQIYQNSTPAIPIIFNSGGVCSGSLISSDMILTAAHCAWNYRPIEVAFPSDINKTQPAKIYKIDLKNDVALLLLNNPIKDITPLKIYDKNQNKINEGSIIATIGHPTTHLSIFHNESSKSIYDFDLDSTYLLSTGVVSKWLENDLIGDLSVSPGNSGGPILNQDGDIVGVISRKRNDFAVGSISYNPNFQTVHKLIESDPSTQDLHWTNARSTLHLFITSLSTKFFGDSKLDTNSPSYKEYEQMYLLGMRIDLFDRITLGLTSNLSETKGLREYSAGWKFIQLTQGKSAISLIPSLEATEYHWKNTKDIFQNQFKVGAGFEIFWNLIPISLKYKTVTNNNSSEDFLMFNFYLN